MKRLLLIAVLALGILNSCQKRPDKTITNLQSAVVDETTASIKYMAYATKANEEGYATLGKLFEAISRSERVHAERFKEYLSKLDANMDGFTPVCDLKSTEMNLESALRMERRDKDTLYPRYLAQAHLERQEIIGETLKWSLEAEKKHEALLTKAYKLLKEQPDSLSSLPIDFLICPICGISFHATEGIVKCTNCGTSSILFIQL